MSRILVIHREPAEAANLAGRLRDRGIDASPYPSLGPRGFREIRANMPEAVLIDLSRAPSYGRTMGALIRESKSLRAIPLVFLTGDPAKTKAVERLLPGAYFAEWPDVPAKLAQACSQPVTEPAPINQPRRSVAAKLGILPDSTLALINDPGDCKIPLPRNVKTVKPAQAAVILCWARNEPQLTRELLALANLTAKGRRIWLLWPKRTSKQPTTLTMPRVRELATHHGLIDYKVCAVDPTWSAMAIGKRNR